MKFISKLFLLSGALSLTSSSAFVVTSKGVSSPSIFAPAMQPLVVPALPASRGMIGSTALQMASSEGEASNLEAARTDEIYKLIDELAWEGADVAEAKKLLDSSISSPKQLSIGETALAATARSDEAQIQAVTTSCALALTSLTIDIIGLVMSIIGLPSKIGKKAAKAIAKEAGEALLDEVFKISVKYFSDAGDLFNVASGVWAFLQALLKFVSIPNIVSSILGSMTWWEAITWTTFVTAQVALLFATNVAGIVVKLALVTPDVVSVVASTVGVVNECD